jgi:hypothetical protein
MQRWAAEIKLRAERRASELLAVMEKHLGGRPLLDEDSEITGHPGVTGFLPTSSELGISKNHSSLWQKLAKVPEGEVKVLWWLEILRRVLIV